MQGKCPVLSLLSLLLWFFVKSLILAQAGLGPALALATKCWDGWCTTQCPAAPPGFCFVLSLPLRFWVQRIQLLSDGKFINMMKKGDF